MNKIVVIISSQEYKEANHQELWKELAKQSQVPVVIANIPADYVVTRIKGRIYRIKEAKAPAIKLAENLFIVRPLLSIRPEAAPSFIYRRLAKQLWKSVEKAVPKIQESFVNVIYYNAYWAKILKGSRENMSLCYYLFDEVRFNANDNTINKRRYLDDEFACRYSDLILTMTSKLADSRREYNNNIQVIGNGSLVPEINTHLMRIQHSIAFIGNFRNWVDKELLTNIIERKKNVLFAFVGPVEDNMKDYLHELLNKYRNTAYFGKVSKNEMPTIYSMFDGVIVPYVQNEFIQATRPIKIVESVLAGTPVVTIPMDGYQSSSFIRFATDVNSFCEEIDYILAHPVEVSGDEYKEFVLQNTWKNKASLILKYIHGIYAY